MRNTFGQNISLTLFGESHGKNVGCVIDGLCSGIEIDEGYIKTQLAKRRPSGKTDTPRVENDDFQIVSGVFNGKTTGTPICIIVPNENTKSKDYNYGVARPSHADYTAFVKYEGNEDFRGGGHFSGRVTVALVIAGAIFLKALSHLGIKIGTHILKCKNAYDTEFSISESDVSREIDILNSLEIGKIPTLSSVEGQIYDEIIKASENKDSVGGILQTAICGLPSGIGEPWFDSFEGVLSHALFSIGGIKGVEFGRGFAFSDLYGSEANDVFKIENGKIVTETNNNGGINGGISNGMPIIFNCAVKPTPSIAKLQKTVDFVNMKETELEIKGRHDPAIIRRACVIVDSVASLCVCDLLCQKYGTDVLKKGIK